MILEVTGHNNTLLRVVAALPHEWDTIRAQVTAKVDRFQSRGKNWDGNVTLAWYLNNDWYIPANCWRRILALRQPDQATLRQAYEVEIQGLDKIIDNDITHEMVHDFIMSLNPPFPDVTDQVTVLHSILREKRTSHHISTGFGKTYLAFLLTAYAKDNYDGQVLIVVPRVILVEQTVSEFREFGGQDFKVYGLCSGFKNDCSMQDADVIIGSYQSLSNMPDDLFTTVSVLIIDEGHTAKAVSIRDIACKCLNTVITTAISGTMGYMSPADALTIESYIGPIVSSYPAWQQIEKGRLPAVQIQPIRILQRTNPQFYYGLLDSQRLPAVSKPPEALATTYRSLEFQYLWFNEGLLDFCIQLAQMHTSRGQNVLIVFKNRIPTINLFTIANERGLKCHMILGGTPPIVRKEIKEQIERETGYMLVATDGTMGMGVSVNNLHALIACMIGHSPHVTLQVLGRMLRNHADKDAFTTCYDIHNELCFPNATSFDKTNYEKRMLHYKNERYPILPLVIRER